MKKTAGIIAGIAGAIITTVSVVLCAIVGFGAINLPIKAKTIGVIGGADGPTAVFITRNAGKDIIFLVIPVIIGIALIISSCFMLCKKKTEENNQ